MDSTPEQAGGGGSYVLRLSGAGQYVEVPAAPELNPTTQMTVEAWIFPEADLAENQYYTIVSKGAAADWGSLLQLHGRRVEWASADTGGRVRKLVSTKELQPGQWTHVAGVYEAGFMRLYVDGRLDTAVKAGGPLRLNNRPLSIGAWLDGGSATRYFPGRVDEVRLWQVARSEAEVLATMNAGLTGNERGLAGYWRFNAGTGDVALDQAGANNAGVLQGRPAWVKGMARTARQGGEMQADPGYGVRLDGRNRVEIPRHGDYRTKVFTLETTVWWSNVGSDQVQYIMAMGPGYAEVSTGVGTNGIRFVPAGLNSYVDAPNVLAPGPNHLAFVYNGPKGIARIYHNGRLVRQRSGIRDIGGLTGATESLTIGARSVKEPRPGLWPRFNGVVREVRLWNTVRSQSEIGTHARRTLTGQEPGLVGYWPLQEGTGSVAKDLTARGNAGTLERPNWVKLRLVDMRPQTDTAAEQLLPGGLLPKPVQDLLEHTLTTAGGLLDPVARVRNILELSAMMGVPVAGDLAGWLESDMRPQLNQAVAQAQLMAELAETISGRAVDEAWDALTTDEKQLRLAMASTRMASDVTQTLSSQAVHDAWNDLIANRLIRDLPNGTYAFTTPAGRTVLRKAGTQFGLCLTVVGPAGSRAVLGLSSADPLCGTHNERLENPEHMPAAVLDISHAFGNVHAMARLGSDEPPYVQAETYVPVGNRWYKAGLALYDPDEVTLAGSLSVAAGGSVDYIGSLGAELGANLVLEATPAELPRLLITAADAMNAAAKQEGLAAGAAPTPEQVGRLLEAGLTALAEDADDLAAVSIEVYGTAEAGLGIWDIVAPAASVTETFTFSFPVAAVVRLNANLLGSMFRSAGYAITDAQRLTIATVNRDAGEVKAALAQVHAHAGSELFSTLENLRKNVAGFTFTISGSVDVAGSGDNSSAIRTADTSASAAINLAEHEISIPVGMGVATALSPDGIVGAIQAGASIQAPARTLLNALDDHLLAVKVLFPKLKQTAETGRFSLDNKTVSQLGELYKRSGTKMLRDNNIQLSMYLGLGLSGMLGAEGYVGGGLGGGINFTTDMELPAVVLGLADDPQVAGKAELSAVFAGEAGLGASVGEGVELGIEATAGLAVTPVKISLEEWTKDQALPPPSGLQVAGFELLDFDGTFQRDGSFKGSGWLALPLGGLVKATVDVDPAGNVRSGRWVGRVEFGPWGFNVGSGKLDNNGLHFDADLSLPLPGGLRLSGRPTLHVMADGQFTGTGSLRLGDTTLADADFALTAYGLKGSSRVLFGPLAVRSSFDLGSGRLQITGSGRFSAGGDIPGASFRVVADTNLAVREGGIRADATLRVVIDPVFGPDASFQVGARVNTNGQVVFRIWGHDVSVQLR